MNHWFEYVKCCHSLVVESEEKINVPLDHEVEAYIVHLMAKNFERTDIGQRAMAIPLLEAVSENRSDKLISVADECLLIHSYPMRQSKWPTATYYKDIGVTAYGLANHMMEFNFAPSSRVLAAVFCRVHTNLDHK